MAGEVRHETGKALGQHCFTGARGPRQQQVMATGGCHLERKPGRFLATDIGQIRHMANGASMVRRCGRGGPWGHALQGFNQLAQRPHRVDNPLAHGPGIMLTRRRHHHLPGRQSVDQRHHPGDAPYRTVQAQLPQKGHAINSAGGQLTIGHQHPDGDGQI